MGKASRDKGARGERLFVRLLQDAGIAAERIPLSGAAGGSFTGDITVPVLGIDRKFECKLRAEGFKEIYKWLHGNFGLFIKADRMAPLAVVRVSDLVDILITAEGNKHNLPPAARDTLETLLSGYKKPAGLNLECSVD